MREKVISVHALNSLKWIPIIILIFFNVEGCEKWKYTQFSFTSLEFPFEGSSAIERLAGFGIPNWSDTEPHNGIDLILYEHLTSAALMSPAQGTMRKIDVRENPYSNPEGQLILSIEIYVNKEYSVFLVIEPGTVDDILRSDQMDALLVKEGQIIERGEVIGNLLVGELGYPHLHLMMNEGDKCVCAYLYSSPTAKQIFDEIIANRESNTLNNGNICGEL